MSDEAVVVGVFSGGLEAVTETLSALSAAYSLPMAIVQDKNPAAADYLDSHSDPTMTDEEDEDDLHSGVADLAMSTCQLLVERDRSLSLSVNGPEQIARLSIQVLALADIAPFRTVLSEPDRLGE